MSEYVLSLIKKHKARGAIVDTNLALLTVIGRYDPTRIPEFKRTIKYTRDDFILLSNVLARLDKRIATPNIATEVDNLTRQLPENEHKSASRAFREIFSACFEIHVPTADAVDAGHHPQMGLTDSIILGLAAQNHLVITDDLALANRISKAGGDAININHIRQFH